MAQAKKATEYVKDDQLAEVVDWYNAVIKPTVSDNKTYILKGGKLLEVKEG